MHCCLERVYALPASQSAGRLCMYVSNVGRVFTRPIVSGLPLCHSHAQWGVGADRSACRLSAYTNQSFNPILLSSRVTSTASYTTSYTAVYYAVCIWTCYLLTANRRSAYGGHRQLHTQVTPTVSPEPTGAGRNELLVHNLSAWSTGQRAAVAGRCPTAVDPTLAGEPLAVDPTPDCQFHFLSVTVGHCCQRAHTSPAFQHPPSTPAASW